MASKTGAATARINSVGSGVADGDLTRFFQLVRLLERSAQCQLSEDSVTLSQLGDDGQPKHEAVRFKANHNLAFAGSPVEELISHLNNADSGAVRQSEVIVNFMGIAGSAGVLPQFYTRMIMERLRQRDSALADFFDMFNHRLVSLFYRAWIKYRITLQYETYRLKNAVDPFTRVVASLSGQTGQQKDSVQNYFSGHFSRFNRNANNLQHMLGDLLKTPVKVYSFVGQWLNIDPRDRSQLSSQSGVQRQRLGEGVLIGRRCWDVQNKVAIEIGPVDQLVYTDIGPRSRSYQRLCELLNAYLPVHLNVDINFRVKNEFGNFSQLGAGARLRENLWLNSRGAEEYTSKNSLDRRSFR